MGARTGANVTFGLTASDLHAARAAVEAALGIQMALHESMYLGGDYFRSGSDAEEHFLLHSNYNDFEKELREPSFPHYDFVLYVNKTMRPEEITRAMRGVGRVMSSRP